MAKRPENLFDKWINGKFDSKLVISVTQKDHFKNLGFSVINGREYGTKLGKAMSVQFGQNDLQELIDTLQEVQAKFFNQKPST